ncbi:Protein IDA-like 2 [Apostasia shenzhenica]|uniref:Protein IDA-like 2 n=1 Tax=Apostasia shenzhenica TaxID=1088818 RepID=A0A2I0B187_9ASPA|nr:Protein IDA-like 2 [Apostasia shenzhenica]
MERLSKRLLLLLLLLLLLPLLTAGVRNVQVLNSRRPANPQIFNGFLPRAMPIPPSGPSKQHNSVGLESDSRG